MPASTPLGFEYPLDGDAPNGPAEMKQIAEKADAFVQAGGVAGHFYTASTLTRASATLGAFSTPAKVELPRVKPGQIIDLLCFTEVTSTIESTSSLGVELGIAIEGVAKYFGNALSSGGGSLPASTWALMRLNSINLNRIGAFLPPIPNEPLSSESEGGSQFFVGGTEPRAVTVELQGRSRNTGTISIKEVLLAARVWG